MDDLVKRVIESRDSGEMAKLLGNADQAARDSLLDHVAKIWANPNTDRRQVWVLLLRMATGFAKCKDYSRGIEVASILEEYARECDDQEILGQALGTMGLMLMESGETPDARKVFEEILVISESIKDTYLKTRCLHNLGIIESIEGQSNQAIARFEEALQLAQSSGDQIGIQNAKRSLAIERDSASNRVCPMCKGDHFIFVPNYGVQLCPKCHGSGKG